MYKSEWMEENESERINKKDDEKVCAKVGAERGF